MREVLWQPPAEQIAKANITKFMQTVNREFGQNIQTYGELYDWSVQDAPAFWVTLWESGGIIASKKRDHVRQAD